MDLECSVCAAPGFEPSTQFKIPEIRGAGSPAGLALKRLAQLQEYPRLGMGVRVLDRQ